MTMGPHGAIGQHGPGIDPGGDQSVAPFEQVDTDLTLFRGHHQVRRVAEGGHQFGHEQLCRKTDIEFRQEAVGDPRRAPSGDRGLDREDLPPHPSATPTRPAHPDRVRDNKPARTPGLKDQTREPTELGAVPYGAADGYVGAFSAIFGEFL